MWAQMKVSLFNATKLNTVTKRFQDFVVNLYISGYNQNPIEHVHKVTQGAWHKKKKGVKRFINNSVQTSTVSII